MEIGQPARSKIIHFEKFFQLFSYPVKTAVNFFGFKRNYEDEWRRKDITSIEVLTRYKQIVFNPLIKRRRLDSIRTKIDMQE